MIFKPLADRVLMKQIVIPLEDKKVGALLIPANQRRPNEIALVISAGDGMKTVEGKKVPMDLKEGDVVVYNPLACQRIIYDDEEYLIGREAEILGVLDESIKLSVLQVWEEFLKQRDAQIASSGLILPS